MKKPHDEHFLDIDDDMLNFLEKQGEDCIREIHQSNSLNKENGQRLLSILIVGIGSSFLLLTQNRYPGFLAAGIAVFTVYWALCAVYLVIYVLSVRRRALASSTPYALYHAGYKEFDEADHSNFKSKGYTGAPSTLNILRRYRLVDLNEIAELSKNENSRIGKGLERVRIATILTPVCALIISALTYFFF
ncbi:hypothetical protein [Serratia sp. M24T3]|uniref:hypothetical protein n=1 Tax=Serratia sp. M24T3 TaxID=932213 RepID=UPI00025B8F56|nr:hypothetical protein [Serratia sp. M24T3]EIC84012.1 hypothetical protein SPM24T3_13885 [Serratia sp. M24T3]